MENQRAILLVVAPSGSRFGSELAKTLATAELRDVRVSRTTAELASMVSSGKRFRLAVVISQTAESAATLVEFVRDTRLAGEMFFVGPSLADTEGVEILPTPIRSEQVVARIRAAFGMPPLTDSGAMKSSAVTPNPERLPSSSRGERPSSSPAHARPASGERPPSSPRHASNHPADVSPALAFDPDRTAEAPARSSQASSRRSRAVGTAVESDPSHAAQPKKTRPAAGIPAYPVPATPPPPPDVAKKRSAPTNAAGIRMSTSLDLRGPRSTKRIPRQIGDWVIERELGMGGMGVVYLGHHVTLEIPVAIKLLLPGADARDVMRFYREAKVAARLDHPNIVRIMSAGPWEDTHYIAMQFIDGDTMKGVLDRHGPVPANRGMQLLVQALSALAHAHARNSIHRDIKPENMMLTKEGDLKITDFGLARSTGNDDIRLTRTGNIIGTPAYMPLEQWNGDDIDHRADLYSLGASFYQLLTGHLPFDADTRGKLVRQIVAGTFTPIAQYRPDLPEALWQTVEALLRQEPDERPQSAREALRMLRPRQ